MTLTFRSKELEREIALDEVWEMPLETVRMFHVELTLAVQSMDDSIREAQRLENDAGVPFDRDWMHKTRKKRRITIMFASEARRRVMKLEGIDDIRQKRSLYEYQRDRFTSIRQDLTRKLLKEELGPGVLEEIENEAHEQAEKDFAAWLKQENQTAVYIT